MVIEALLHLVNSIEYHIHACPSCSRINWAPHDPEVVQFTYYPPQLEELPLDHDHIMGLGQSLVAFADKLKQIPVLRKVTFRPEFTPDPSLHDHLRALLGLGFEQDGIHIHMRQQAAGLSL